jgi:probable HAF family extracellular repeat protein
VWKLMNGAQKLLAALSLVLVVGATTPGPARASGGYTITDLGTFGGMFSAAYGINDNGDVVGEAEFPNGDSHAFLYDGALPIDDLGTLGGTFSSAQDVNINNEVAGDSTDAAGIDQSFSWTAGLLQPIQTLGGSGGFAVAVNDNGVIVGNSDTAAGELHVYMYDGSLTDVSLFLAPLGATFSIAGDINASNEVVGQAVLSNFSDTRGFRWSPGNQAQLLDALLEGKESGARAVSSNGEVVGFSDSAGAPGDYHAVAWNSSGSITDLGKLGGSNAVALGVDDAGEVVGLSSTANGDFHAFLYSGGVLADVNDLLPTGSPWLLDVAYDVNAAGQIVGGGYVGSEYHAYLLTPNTPAGTSVVAHPVDQTTGTSPVTLTFANVTQGGGTTLATSASGPSPPAGFNLGDPPTYYELSTTASFTGSVQVCIDATGVTFNGPPALWHYDGGTWVNVTTSVNGQIVCGSVTSLSPFALFAQPSAPTYHVCLLYDPGRPVKAGGTMPIKLQLCDANGANLSAPDIVLHAQGVQLVSTSAPGQLTDAGNANPDNNFRYDATLGGTGGYIYNLSTKGLATGTYAIEFIVGSNPHVYRAQFEVR